MEITEALKELKNGKIRPVYVLFGSDRYRINQFVDKLSDTLFKPDEKELGVVKFDTAETAIDEVVLEAETPPFFMERKLIWVRDSSVLAASAGKENAKIEHKPETLLAYLDNPSDFAVIVFTVQADKLDERRKLVKALKDRNAFVAFQELDASQLKQWAIKRASDQKRTMTEAAAELLLSRTGAHMQQLALEVDKLCLHAGPGGTIDEEQTAMLIASTVEEDVFALVDAMAGLQVARSLQLYKELLTRKEEPIRIAALIARQIRIMLQIKELEPQGYSPQQMAGQLGLHPYAVKLAVEKSRRFSVQRLAVLLSDLAELDYKMKTGAIDKTLGLELFLLSLGVSRETAAR
ncbi:DNA polymerase III subunit delta [Paenibacillus protaetiae]|uniref:DNA polymerase III subunit delta n=1 Tax=Paenibacillus protaetiae TaxID=2509456 RepID=A0A4P6ET58_9BACL|nr:DNA polymerase III subunit delta [Paenibacillus protaetiae]QAY66340.1 DNA polymerase III subunit delta [Paenibacillus protaetiae]